MKTTTREPITLWQEQSAIWEIISGEIVRQHDDPGATDPVALVALATERATDAAARMREGDRDSAGHALIGCSLALGLAARASAPDETTIDHYGAELAAAVSWRAVEPSAAQIAALADDLRNRVIPDASHGAPSVWELAIRAGACAAGLSAYITRRRGRRDQVSSEA